MAKSAMISPEHPHLRSIAAILQFLGNQGFHQTKEALCSELGNGVQIPDLEHPDVLLNAMDMYEDRLPEKKGSPSQDNSNADVLRRIYENDAVDIPNTEPVACLRNLHNANIVALSWHRDRSAKLIASGSADGCIQVTDTETEASILGCSVAAPVLSMDFNPVFTNLLAVGCFDGSIHFLDIASGDKSSIGPVSHKRITCVRFSPDGFLLATASADHTMALYRVANPVRDPVQWNEVHRLHFVSTPESVCWIGEKLVVSARGDHDLYYYDVGRSLSLARRLNMNTHGDDYCSFNVLDLCTGNTDQFYDLCMASTDKNRAVLFNESTKGPVFSLYGAVNDEYSTPRTSFSCHDSSFYSTSQDNTVVVWDLKTQRVQKILSDFAKLPRDLSVDKTSGDLAVCSYDRTIRVFSCESYPDTS